jgi:hypothetical protein
MEPIRVPKPKGERDPNRSAGTLLLAQVRHLQKAERTLPPKYHSGIFHKAIETEDEAARYIQAVTRAIHKAHDDAVRERARRAAARKKVIRIAAKASQAPDGKRISKKKKAMRKS